MDACTDMTLRDHFAIQALPALITGRSWLHVPGNEVVPMWASAAYAVADAMLAERAK